MRTLSVRPDTGALVNGEPPEFAQAVSCYVDYMSSNIGSIVWCVVCVEVARNANFVHSTWFPICNMHSRAE